MKQLLVVLIAFLAISFSADLAQAQSPLDRVIAGNLQLIDQYSSYGYGYHGYGGYGYGYRRPNFGHRLGRIFEYGAVRAIDDYFDRRQPVIMMPGYEEPYYPSTRYPEAKVQSNSSNRVSRGIISFVRNVSGVSLYIYYWENGQRHLRSDIFPSGIMEDGAKVENFPGSADALEAIGTWTRCSDGSPKLEPARKVRTALVSGLRFERP